VTLPELNHLRQQFARAQPFQPGPPKLRHPPVPLGYAQKQAVQCRGGLF
jgi:hypothetical protein